MIDVVVSIAIVGILVSIAIPRFQHMSYQSKLSEAPVNSDSIMLAENAYDTAFDRFVATPGFAPRTLIDKRPVPWVGNEGFDTIGWSPDGDVRCRYEVQLHHGNRAVLVQTQCNVDGIGSYALFQKWQASRAEWRDWQEWKTPSNVY